MKTKSNFKYAIMMAAALVLGFSSCSNDDETIDNQPVEGVETIAKITLTQKRQATTYGPTGTENPTDKEKVVKRATLYVFSTSKVLEKEVSLDVTGGETGAEKIVKLTTGTKYFYAAVNIPTGMEPTFTLGMPMDVVVKELLTVTDVRDLYSDVSGFFMTNVDAPQGESISLATESDVTTTTINNITIPIGRAMIKASMKYTKANVIQPAIGALDDVGFLLANNPTQMHYMANVNNFGQLETPFFFNPEVTGMYYPTLGADATGLVFIETNGTATTYGMENSNQTPKTGNTTFALIQGIFTPAAVVDKDGEPETINLNGDFWRIQLADESFTDKLYMEDPTGGTDITGLTNAKAVKYAEGLCYYSLYLADNSINNNTTLKYTVKRNSFWKMTITSVGGVGSNTPEGVVPEVEDPIEAETYIKAKIDVLDWDVYDQSGGI